MRGERGFSYVVVMFLVAVTSILSLRALEYTQTAEQRAKEDELLWRGMAYRRAIQDFYLRGPGSGHALPTELGQLLDDTRFVRRQRWLRKPYRDPLTADGNWGLIYNDDGKLIGVYSKSTAKPKKQAGFPTELQAFTNAQHYSDWKFVVQQ